MKATASAGIRTAWSKEIWKILVEVYEEWDNDHVSQLAAALTFYLIFSLAPLLLIALALGGIAFGREAARGELLNQIRGMIGWDAAEVVQILIAKSAKNSSVATAIGASTSLLGATVVFVALQDALNTIWGVMPKPGAPIRTYIRKRLLSYIMILGTGFLLVLSVLAGTLISLVQQYLSSYGNLYSEAHHTLSPVPLSSDMMQAINTIASLAVFALLFALIYKFLPDAEISWRNVWSGAAITSLLFTGGKYLIGLYLGRSSYGSTYGAAGSLVLLLVWVYYSAQIFLIGGEFTQVLARRHGSEIRPSEGAVRVTKEIRIPAAGNAASKP